MLKKRFFFESISTKNLFQILENIVIVSASEKITILRKCRVRPIPCRYTKHIIDQPEFCMSEIVASIISKIYRNINFLKSIEKWIIDTRSSIYISLEYDTNIDSSSMRVEYGSEERFLCPSIYLYPYTFLCSLNIMDSSSKTRNIWKSEKGELLDLS